MSRANVTEVSRDFPLSSVVSVIIPTEITFPAPKKDPMSRRTQFYFSILMVSSVALADESEETNLEVYTLPPVITEGTPAEALKFDPIVPAMTAKTPGRSSTGDVVKEISNELPFHSASNLKPGNESGFTGAGKSSEETDVNVLGIPINRPQGGGADLAIFPQYFWSGFSYQIGPSLGAFDPRGVSGSLTLRLWTQDALGTQEQKATVFSSSRGNGIDQISYGRSGERYALMAGLSKGDVFGPGIAFAAIPFNSSTTKVTTHLLFADARVKNYYSERTSTTQARQRTDRVIPVLQLDHKFSSDHLFKTSFFYDFTYVDYRVDNSPSSRQRKRTHQVGNESALLLGSTRLGLGVRSVSYERHAQSAIENLPSEQIVNAQLTHGFRFGNILLEPTVGGTAVTRKGFYPYGTIGARHEIDGFGQFARVGFHQRFASLTDRYYEFLMVQGPTTLQAIPNPGLRSEFVRAAEAGLDFKKDGYRVQLTGFARDYKHARYTATTTIDPPPPPTYYQFQIRNAGNAYIYGVTHTQDITALPVLDLGLRGTFMRSKIEDLGAQFPYSPELVGIVKADLHHPDRRYGLTTVLKGATDMKAYTETTGSPARLPGYGYLDVYLYGQVHEGVTVTGGVENVFNRKIASRISEPEEGIVYSLSIAATF